MKKLARIPSFLLTPKDTQRLQLQNQAFLLIIPKKLIEELDLPTELSFDLIFENNRLSLVGPESTKRDINTGRVST